MNKCHTPINFQNGTTPALNQTNLNYLDGCVDTIDDRVVAMDTAKLEPSDVATTIKNVTFNESTGIFTFTRYNDSTFTLDTKLEKVVTNWTYDSTTQSLVLTLADGSTVNVSLSAFIQENEFVDSATIAFTVTNHTVTAGIKANSIGDAQMQTQYLTDCQAARTQAQTASGNAQQSEDEAEGYAVGTQQGSPVSSSSPYYHNNAKYWAEQAQAIAGQSVAGLSDVDLEDPVNGQTLVYNSGTGFWENGTPVQAIGDLSDVNLGTLANGEVLTYNSTSGKWSDVYPSAEGTDYNNSISLMNAQNVQEAVDELNSGKQPKTLATAITIGGTSQTTVEGALGALNTSKQPKTLATALTINGTQQTTVEGALGGINTAITNGLKYTGQFSASASTDGTHTYSYLIGQIYSSLVYHMSGKGSSYRYRLSSANIDGNVYSPFVSSLNSKPFYGAKFQAFSLNQLAPSLTYRFLYVYSSPSIVYFDGSTVTDMGSSVPASGSTYTVYIDEFQVIT